MSTTRRHFLQAGAVAGVAASVSTAVPARAIAANDRLRIATIGMGSQGTRDTLAALRLGDAELVAVADVYDGRLARAREVFGPHVAVTRDYREVLARRDVDAVIVSTPDHWHSRITLDALAAGKHVYCEKPVVQRLEEGHAVVDAGRASRHVLQVGSQRVSGVLYQKARDLYEAGAIGEIVLAEAWWNRHTALEFSIPPDASEATVDWEGFLGMAPRTAFHAARAFRWRNYAEYGAGIAGDLFVHLFSGLHFITGSTGPTRVYASGAPGLLRGLYDYPGFNLSLSVNLTDGGNESSGFRIVGSEGVLTIGEDVTLSKATDESEPESAETWLAPEGYSDHLEHLRRFAGAVRNGTPVVEDAAFGFRAAGPALLSNISHAEGKICTWDPAGMTRTS